MSGMHASRLPRWAVVLCAGIAAGTVATLVQVLLWLALGADFPAVLLRDARLTAALVLGAGVLPPPASFDGWIWLVATAIHFALSAAYAALLRPLALRLGRSAALLSGAVSGVVLYGINLYGFTGLFPWMVAARGASAAAAHIAFGVTAVAVCRCLAFTNAGCARGGH